MNGRVDCTGAFAFLIAGAPFVLPVLGVELADLAFALPLMCFVWATSAAWRTASRRPARAGAWRMLGLSCAFSAVVSGFGLLSAIADVETTYALHAGVVASVALVLAAARFARDALRNVGRTELVDPLLLVGAFLIIGIREVMLPAGAADDPLLLGVLLVDLGALVLWACSAAGPMPDRTKVLLGAGCLVFVLGDGWAAVHVTSTAGVAALWSVAAIAFAAAAGADLRAGTTDPRPPSARRTYARTLLPLAGVVAYPAAAGLHFVLDERFDSSTAAFYLVCSVVSTAVAFGRQAHLLVDNRRAVQRERALRDEAQRRAGDLEALTTLATTMTEVLDEQPMIERGLDALRWAARTSSSALHMAGEDGRLQLVAATGTWSADAVWAPAVELDRVETSERGRRHIARLPLSSRGEQLGLVTLVRPLAEGSFAGEVALLSLLVDQLAVAVQNARDYRDKLEAAIRDPLTGVYNRRFFYEAFAKEINRHERYGTTAALVFFDIDDFKSINDTLGHAAGDEVLQRVADIIGSLIRPSDSFARTGGEEFALLLPETGQLDALLAAERLRTAISRHKILPGRQVTLSGGVAALGQDGSTREEVERKADAALYWAKRNGKNMCAVAREMDEEVTADLAEGMLAHLHAVVAGIDSQHLYTRDHSENVAAYAVAIAQAMGLTAEQIVRLRRAAFLHDVGKIAVPDAVLGKPSGLTDEEFRRIQIHPEVGGHMLDHAGLREESVWVRHHHERIDGGGYPDGLRGDEIPLEARIIFVADSFEAMTSDRPYRDGMPVADAVTELRRCAGTQFDPACVAALEELLAADRLAVLALRHDAA